MLHPKMAHVYVGVDIHRQTHTATIINCFFENLGEITFKNRLTEFSKLENEVRKHISDGITPIYGLEDCVSLGRELATYLIGQGNIVKYVNPSLTKSERSSQASLHKTDTFDSLCISRALLSKLTELPDAKVDYPLWALAELVTKRNSLVKMGITIKNQLHTHIAHNYPGYKQFFGLFDCKTALAFWGKYPSPSKLKGVSFTDLSSFLQKESHCYHSFDKACEIFSSIADDGVIEHEMQDIHDSIISMSVRQLKSNAALIEELECNINKLVPTFGYKLHTMKGISNNIAAALIAEIGDINRFSNANQLASYAGISPVQYSSGETERTFCNKLGNRNLNRIIFLLAVSQCNDHGEKGGPFNGLFAEYFKKKMSEGKTKKQAIKCVMRRHVNIIFRLMKDKSDYKPPRKIQASSSKLSTLTQSPACVDKR
jgi:transposase